MVDEMEEARNEPEEEINLLPVEQIEIKDGRVNVRHLHAALGVGRRFAGWFQERRATLELVDGEDFGIKPGFGNNSAGRPEINYWITTDIAKHLCMMEGNEAGRLCRRYFIEAEKKLTEIAKSAPTMPDLSDNEATARLLAEYATKYADSLKRIAADAPYVPVGRLMHAVKGITLTQLARALTANQIKYGVVRLGKELRNRSILNPSTKTLSCVQKYLDMGWFGYKPVPVRDYTKDSLRVTAKGIEEIFKLFGYHVDGDEIVEKYGEEESHGS